VFGEDSDDDDWQGAADVPPPEQVGTRDSASHKPVAPPVSKYLNMEVQEEPKYQRRSQSTRLTPFNDALVRALSVDARRPKEERRTAWMLFQEIEASGYDGCYSRVTDFIWS